jgi:hypothetical protein
MRKFDLEEKTSGTHVNIIKAVQNPLGFFTLAVLVINVILGILAYSIEGPERTWLLRWMIISLLALISIVALITFFRPQHLLGINSKETSEPIKISKEEQPQAQTAKKTEPKVLYANSDDAEFSALFEQNLLEAKTIAMIGTGFNILRRDPMMKIFIRRIQDNCQINILAANPFSPNVQTRLIEEETNEVKPLVGKAGLVEWMGRLLYLRKQMGNPSKLVLRLFPYYPSYAVFIFDGQDYFYYPYGYAQLGTLSPVFHFTKSNPAHEAMILFLDGQFNMIDERSTDAKIVFDLHSREKVDPAQLTAFAVYIVPRADSPLYKFGSQVLEYDLRAARDLQPMRWHSAIGAAADFGFHLTVADALYCTQSSDVDLINEEVEFIAKEFRTFPLSFILTKDFPNHMGISLVCQDESGSLEALHHEMVARVYRKAAASNYSLGIAKADRDSNKQRSDLMIQRYHAPYILQQFKPHFSLLSNVPQDRKDQLFHDLKKIMEKHEVDSSILIDSIVLMHRPEKDKPWRIHSEHKLGGGS